MEPPSGRASFSGCASILSIDTELLSYFSWAKNTLLHTCALIVKPFLISRASLDIRYIVRHHVGRFIIISQNSCNDLGKSASHICAITPKGLVNLKLP